MAKKKLRESTCRHAHCREPIYYSDFTGSWCHWSTAGEPYEIFNGEYFGYRLTVERIPTPQNFG